MTARVAEALAAFDASAELREGVVAGLKRLVRHPIEEVPIDALATEAVHYLREYLAVPVDPGAIRRSALSLLRKLEGPGARLLVGRRGGRTRLQVGPAVLEVLRRELAKQVNLEDEERLDAAHLLATGSEPPAGDSTRSMGLVVYPFPLRPGVTAELRLPAELRRAEVARLTKFIEALSTDADA